MFCRKEEDLKEEEDKKKAAMDRQVSTSTMSKTVLDIKQINDITMTLASLRISASDVVDALTIVDDFALSAD